MVFRSVLFLITSSLIIVALAGHAPADDNVIGMDTFKARRQALMDSIGDGTAVLYSQGRDTEAGYRADGDFWYLTGIDEEDAILMLSPNHTYREVLFLPSRDPEAERWSGWRPELTDSLMRAWGFDDIRRIDAINWMIVDRMKQEPVLHLISGLVSPDDSVPPDKVFYGDVTERIPGIEVKNSSRFLESMRMVKSDREIAAIEMAIAITHKGIGEVLAAMQPGVTEYQLEAVLETSFKRQGSQFMAFPAIIAAGGNSHFLHYEKRRDTLRAGQLMLMDVGASWDHYCADITRTVPIDGKFTNQQAEIYDIVLEAQDSVIAQIRPGVTYYDVHKAAERVFRRAGYIDDFWHGTGHHLGVNVHDPADYNATLEPGMILTAEPGIYLPDLQFGIRIEDDVLVTEDGKRVLSADIPRTRAEVEAWIAEMKR